MLKNATLIALLFVGASLAKKGGSKGRLDLSGVFNPDPEAEKIKSPEYNPNLVEGDIVVKDASNSEDRNAVSDANRLWPQGTVPYEWHSSVGSELKAHIMTAIKDYNMKTCIKFVPRSGEYDYVLFKSLDEGCFALKGREGGQQPLNLAYPGCHSKGTIIHEMLHTLGFAHEQNRSDRDKYITVHYNNIYKEAQRQFDKLKTSEEDTQGYFYDYSSVMHYGSTGFSKNTRPTITTNDPKHQNKIGQRAGFSFQDIAEVNSLYKCKNGKSGVGGVNGCSDTDGPRCADLTSYKNGYHCRDKITRDYCRKSCKQC